MARRRKLSLTRLEAEIMRVVWDAAPQPVRVRDVLDRLNEGRSRALAYNTVQTVMTILRAKGALDLVRGGGRAHRYRARCSRDEISRHMAADLAERLFDGHVQPLLLQLIDQADLKPDELKSLRKWVDARLRDAEE